MVMVRMRFSTVVGRKGTASTHRAIKAGISFGFHKNTNTAMEQARPTHAAREYVIAMAMPPTQKIPAAMTFHCQCFAVMTSTSTSGSSSSNTCAKVLGLSKME